MTARYFGSLRYDGPKHNLDYYYRDVQSRISLNRVLSACSAGVLPLPSSHAVSFPTDSSCVTAGAFTSTL